MNNVVCVTLVLLSLTQPLLISARAGGHGRARPRRRPRPYGSHGPGAEVDSHRTHEHDNYHFDLDVYATAPPADVEQSCGNANDTDFCVKSMKENPESKDKDLKQLSLVALEMANKKGMEIFANIDQRRQKKERLPPLVDTALNVCFDRYAEANSHLGDAINALLNPIKVPFDDIKRWLNGAMTNAQVCQIGIADAKTNSLLFQGADSANTVFFKQCDNALSIITSFQFVTWVNSLH